MNSNRGRVIANMSVSLDGFVQHPSDGVTSLFRWYSIDQGEAGVEVRRDPGQLGALVYGRTTFEEAHGWGGHHPMGAPVVVLTHTVPDGWPKENSTVEFVTDGGIEAALQRAQELAGGKIVALGSPTVTQQALNAGLLDEIQVDLVPFFLGQGVRWFDNIADTPRWLSDPRVIPGRAVTHLHYQVNAEPGATPEA